MVSLDESRWIPVEKVIDLLEELVLRCGGVRSAARYSGIHYNTILRMQHKQVIQVRRKTVRLLILALYERRKEDRRNGQSKAFRHAKVMQARMEDRMLDLIGY